MAKRNECASEREIERARICVRIHILASKDLHVTQKTNIPERVSCHFSKFYCNVCTTRKTLMLISQAIYLEKLCLNFLQRGRNGQELSVCAKEMKAKDEWNKGRMTERVGKKGTRRRGLE